MGNLLSLPNLLGPLAGLESKPTAAPPAPPSPDLEAMLDRLETLLSQRLQSDASSSQELTRHSRALKKAEPKSRQEAQSAKSILDSLAGLLPEALELAPLLAL